MRLSALLGLLLLLAGCPRVPRTQATGAEPGQAWPLFHADVARTGHSEVPAIRKPKILWKARVGVQSWLNSPVVADDLVFVGSAGTRWNKPDPGDGVYALRLSDGKVAWFSRFGDDANGVAVAGGRVVASSDDGHVYGLDIKTGKVLWKVKGEGKVYSYPLVVEDLVVVGDSSGTLRGLKLSDGSTRWKVKVSGAIRGGASADDAYIYAASQNGEVVAVRPGGEVVWRIDVRRPGPGGELVPVKAFAAPLVAGSLVVIPFVRDALYPRPALLALDAGSGRVRWRAQGDGKWANIRATPVLSGGILVYVEAYSGDVVGVSATDGRVLYRRTIGPCFYPHWAAGVSARGTVYLPRTDGTIYAVRFANGEVLWRLYLGDSKRAGPTVPKEILEGGRRCRWKPPVGSQLLSPPAVGPDGTLYVGTGEGFLFAIGEDG